MAYTILEQGVSGNDLVIKGAVTGTGAINLIPLVENNIDKNVKRVVVDLGDCQLLTTDLLGYICLLQKNLEERNIPVVLTRLEGLNKQIYDKLHIDHVLPLDNTGQ